MRLFWRYVLATLITAAYWLAAAWVCFALTRLDPVDLATGAQGGRRDEAALVMIAAVLLFALLDRSLQGRLDRLQPANG